MNCAQTIHDYFNNVIKFENYSPKIDKKKWNNYYINTTYKIKSYKSSITISYTVAK